jgi:hypothetical protein
MSPAEIEQAFQAFIDRVEGAIRRMPASEVAAERDRLRAEAIAPHVRMTAKPSFAVAPSASAPVPVASEPRQVAQR